MNALIAVLDGDGVGPEITAEAVRVLRAVGDRFGHGFRFNAAQIGGAAIDASGSPFPDETRELCDRADAVLLGAVGGPKWDNPEAPVRPEQGLLALRKHLSVFANIRPVRGWPALGDRGPLKPEIAANVDMVIVRELTGGIYFGKREEGEQEAADECRYTAHEIERVVRVACELALQRSGRLASLDKANVLATSRLWRRTVERVVRDEFPAIELEHVLIDSAAMHLITRPERFDVIVTENMFGDIISDEASVLTGSIGVLGSASVGEAAGGLFEPIHGSAPDIAGRGIANPIGAIMSAAMLLRNGLGLGDEADAVESAVAQAFSANVRTADLGGEADTSAMGEWVAGAIAPRDARCQV